MRRFQLPTLRRTTVGRRSRAGRLRAAGIAAVAIVLISACGDSDDAPDTASASFDGEKCSYDGPTEFDLNTQATFTVTNTSDRNDVGFSLWKAPNGTTVAEIEQSDIFEVIPGGFDQMRVARFEGQNLPGDEHEMTVDLDTTGTWILNCWNPDSDRPATAFEVAGSELTDVVDDYVAAYNAGDADAVASYFSNDAVITSHPFRGLTEGSEAIRTLMQSDINASDQSGKSYEISNVRATDTTVTFDHAWSSGSGSVCIGDDNEATIQDGKITNYKFANVRSCS